MRPASQSMTNTSPTTALAATAPTVLSVAAQANGVAPNREIAVTFSEAMDPATINSTTFFISGVDGAVSYDAANKIASLKPVAQLKPLTAYTATVTTGVANAAGQHMAQNYVFSFTTRADQDTSPPTVVDKSPIPGSTCVPVNTVVTYTFSEGLDPATINTSTFFIQGVQGTVTYDAVSFKATFTPAAPLQPNTLYSGKTTTGIADLAGVHIAGEVPFYFTTAAASGTCASGGGTGATYLYVGVAIDTAAIRGYKVDRSNATLAEVPGSPFAQSGPESGIVTVSRNFVYTSTRNVSDNSATITALQPDPASGSLTQIGTTTFANTTQAVPFSEPTGHNLYVIDGTGDILTLIINSDGTLTNTGQSLHLAEGISSLTVSPNGQLAYAEIFNGTFSTGFTDGTVALNRDPNSGTLTVNHQLNINQHLYGLQFDPSGKYLLALNSGPNNQIYVDSVDYSTGDLTPVPGSPFPSAGVSPAPDFTRIFRFDPSGMFVYALDDNGADPKPENVWVLAFSQATGTLAPIQMFDLAPGTNPVWLVIDQSLAFVTNTNSGFNPSNIDVLRRDPNSGMLSAGGSPVVVPGAIAEAEEVQF